MTKEQKKDMWKRQYNSLMEYDNEISHDMNKNAKTKILMRKAIGTKIYQAEAELRQLGALPRKPASTPAKKQTAKKTVVKKTKKTITKKTTSTKKTTAKRTQSKKKVKK
jgi:hypothetical protein